MCVTKEEVYVCKCGSEYVIKAFVMCVCVCVRVIFGF